MRSKKGNKTTKISGVVTRRMTALKNEKKRGNEKCLLEQIEQNKKQKKTFPEKGNKTTKISGVVTRQMAALKNEKCLEKCLLEKIEQNQKQKKTLPKKMPKINSCLIEYDGNFEIFLVGDIVWAKLKGHPVWPAKVIFVKIRHEKYEIFRLNFYDQ